MIYQVRVNMLIANEGAARGLFNHCQGLFPQASTINPTAENAEHSTLELIENHHDETPTSPCLLIEHASS